MLEIKKNLLSVSCNIYDHQPEGIIYSITLKNRDISVSITNLGCIITAISTPCRNGDQHNIVAGYSDIKDYRENEHYFGCLLGRYANRIANARFKFDGHTYYLSQNDGVDHLHGGFNGFNKKIFNVVTLIQEDDKVGVEFEYLSKDGEEGYPGNLTVKVQYVLNDANQLVMSYEAETDQPTPVNLANHSYFNLTGFETDDILAHQLQINAGSCTETRGDIPTGNIIGVTGTQDDFTIPREIGYGNGYNQNYVLENYEAGKVVFAAKLSDNQSGRSVSVYTNQPGLQLYTANTWDGSILGAQGKYYKRCGAVALEAQNFPDSPNHPDFPNSILHPGDTYRATTIYEFGNE